MGKPFLYADDLKTVHLFPLREPSYIQNCIKMELNNVKLSFWIITAIRYAETPSYTLYNSVSKMKLSNSKSSLTLKADFSNSGKIYLNPILKKSKTSFFCDINTYVFRNSIKVTYTCNYIDVPIVKL